MKQFSKNWIRSKRPAKQRKFKANAPLHMKQKFNSSKLSKPLKEKYNRRSIGLRTGDKVKIMRGQFKGRSGKVEKVMLKEEKAFISGIDVEKKDGSKAQYPIHVSNLMIEDISLDDKKRKQKCEKNGKKSS